MKKGENTNHPQVGDSIKVEPIRQLKDIKAIKRLLQDNPRDLCLFTVGINTNLRASDLLQITAASNRKRSGASTGMSYEVKTDESSVLKMTARLSGIG